jgi:hypothetical protein
MTLEEKADELSDKYFNRFDKKFAKQMLGEYADFILDKVIFDDDQKEKQ